MEKRRLHVGIDEAGRGPLAGPLVVGGVSVEKCFLNVVKKRLKGIRDSKRLTPKKREEWFSVLTTHPRIQCAVSFIQPGAIDRINVHQAALRGVKNVLRKVGRNNARIFLDGSLLAPQTYRFQKTIIKGDALHPLIMAASIIAKVTRDRIMLRLNKKYPLYAFHKHKGYGTNLHRFLVRRYGPSEVHRMSFLRKII